MIRNGGQNFQNREMVLMKYSIFCGILIILLNLTTVLPVVYGFNAVPEITVVSHNWYQELSLSIRKLSSCGHYFLTKNLLPEYCYPLLPQTAAHEPIDSYSTELSPDLDLNEELKTVTIKPEEFVYQARYRNESQKTIKAITWDYVFTDPESGKELARHRFFNEIKIKPGQTKTLDNRSTLPPTLVIDVGMLTKNDSETYGERILIRKILYTDGTSWQNNADK